jgi:hypothetical protein
MAAGSENGSYPNVSLIVLTCLTSEEGHVEAVITKCRISETQRRDLLCVVLRRSLVFEISFQNLMRKSTIFPFKIILGRPNHGG